MLPLLLLPLLQPQLSSLLMSLLLSLQQPQPPSLLVPLSLPLLSLPLLQSQPPDGRAAPPRCCCCYCRCYCYNLQGTTPLLVAIARRGGRRGSCISLLPCWPHQLLHTALHSRCRLTCPWTPQTLLLVQVLLVGFSVGRPARVQTPHSLLWPMQMARLVSTTSRHCYTSDTVHRIHSWALG